MSWGGMGVGNRPWAGNSVPLRPHLSGCCFHQVHAGGPKRALALYHRRAENGVKIVWQRRASLISDSENERNRQ